MTKGKKTANNLPLLGFVAFSGTGKTTLLCKLLPLLQHRGIRVGVIKNTHHDFEIDIPGKDSYELRKAGASQMLVTSGKRWALITETGLPDSKTGLKDCISRMDTDQLDIILVEGFKDEEYPKIELNRKMLNKPFLYPGDNNIIAIAMDKTTEGDFPIPVLDINDPEAICHFILSITANASQATPVFQTGLKEHPGYQV